MDDDQFFGFSSDDANRVAKATLQVEAWGSQPPVPGRQPSRAGELNDGVWCINDPGEQIPPMSIACADTLKADLDYGGMKLKKPGTTFRKRLIITGESYVESGKPLWFPSQRFYRVKYDSGTPAPDEGWGPKPGQWTISKGFPGCTICGILDATNKIALVSLDSPIVTLLGKGTGAIGAASSGTNYRIYGGTAGSEADCGFTTVPTAYNKGATAIANNDWVWLEFTNNAWYIGKIC